MDFDAIIIGAGIAGLVAAYELQKREFNVLLLEKSARVGGVMRTDRVDGYLLERGPNSYLESEEADRIITELGFRTEMVTADPKLPRYLYYRGRLVKVPFNPWEFITSPLLSLTGKLRIFAEPLIRPRAEDGEESIASFVRRRIGQEAHDRLVAPLVSGIYAGNTEQLSINASFPTLAELEAKYGSVLVGAFKSAREKKRRGERKSATSKRLCSFKEGIGALPQRLAEVLDESLLTGCEIVNIAIERERPRYRVTFRHKEQTIEHRSNNLILATPAPATAEMLAKQLPTLVDELKQIEYARVAIVYLSFNKRELGRDISGFGFLVPRSEGLRLLGSVWSSSLFPGRAPADQQLFTNIIGGAMDAQAVDMSDGELIDLITDELTRALEVSARPKAVEVYRVREAIPQFTIGHAARADRINLLVNKQPGLYLIGNYIKGVSVPDCISRACDTAAKVVK